MGFGHRVFLTGVARAGKRDSAPAGRRLARSAANFLWNGLGLVVGMMLLGSAFVAWF